MVTGRQFLVEILRALCVLGLLFLNLAHVPAASASDEGVLCGPSAASGHVPDDKEPCPACRLADAGFVLPAGAGADHLRAAAPTGYDAPAAAPREVRALSRAWARGPPLA